MTIGSVVFFTLLLVTGNTMAIAVRERTGELAVLKTVGFSDRGVLGLVLAESVLIAGQGGVLGLAAREAVHARAATRRRGMLGLRSTCRWSSLGLGRRRWPLLVGVARRAPAGGRGDAAAGRRRAAEGVSMAIPLVYNVRSVRAALDVRRSSPCSASRARSACSSRCWRWRTGSRRPWSRPGRRATRSCAARAPTRRWTARSPLDAAARHRETRRAWRATTAGRWCPAEVVVIAGVPAARRPGPTPTSRCAASRRRRCRCATTCKIVQGRFFQPGLAELVVGRNAARPTPASTSARTVRFGGGDWTVVGVFDAGGSAFDSEVWCDANVLSEVYKRPANVFQSVTVRLDIAGGARRVQGRAHRRPAAHRSRSTRETSYYEKQSRDADSADPGARVPGRDRDGHRRGVRRAQHDVLGGVGALARDRDAAGARLRRRQRGRLVRRRVAAHRRAWAACSGCLAVLPINGLTTGTMNWQTFSHLAFAFRITPALLGAGDRVRAADGPRRRRAAGDPRRAPPGRVRAAGPVGARWTGC